MTLRFVVSACLSAVVLTAGLHAQTTTTKTKEPAGPANVVSSTLAGEVALVEGNQLLVRMQQSGRYRYFSLKPGQQFQIDGQRAAERCWPQRQELLVALQQVR